MNDVNSNQALFLATEVLPDNYILNSSYEIENALLVIKQMENKIEWLGELKKTRNRDLDSEVTKLSERTELLRHIILLTMQKLEPDRKTLPFPSIGKVTRRDATPTWEIIDEEDLINFVDGLGRKSEIIKTKESLDRTAAKKLITELTSKQTDQTIPGVQQNPGAESIAISFETKKASLPKQGKIDRKVLGELDELEL